MITTESYNSNAQNQLLTKMLLEKELMIKEIHHRFKNNMQIVLSLLNTQLCFLDSENAAEALLNCQHRIQVMSLIHQKLHLSGTFKQIDMANYIFELADYLKRCVDPFNTIDFELNLEKLNVDIAHAVPLGLIVNEAVTNAVKYAFPGKGRGKITVTLRSVGAELYLLSIADNGVGLPQGFDKNRTASMGMELMQGLAGQLNGQFKYISDNGLSVSVLFKNHISASNGSRAA